MLKRYDLKTEYNKYACEDQVVPVEDVLGDWVKWVDVADLMTRQLHKDARNQLLIELHKTLIESLRKENEQLQQALSEQ